MASFFDRLNAETAAAPRSDPKTHGAEALADVLELVRTHQVSMPGHICATGGGGAGRGEEGRGGARAVGGVARHWWAGGLHACMRVLGGQRPKACKPFRRRSNRSVLACPVLCCAAVVTTMVLEGWSNKLDPHHSTLQGKRCPALPSQAHQQQRRDAASAGRSAPRRLQLTAGILLLHSRSAGQAAVDPHHAFLRCLLLRLLLRLLRLLCAVPCVPLCLPCPCCRGQADGRCCQGRPSGPADRGAEAG